MKKALMESISKQGVPATKPKWLNLQEDYRIAFFSSIVLGVIVGKKAQNY